MATFFPRQQQSCRHDFPARTIAGDFWQSQFAGTFVESAIGQRFFWQEICQQDFWRGKTCQRQFSEVVPPGDRQAVSSVSVFRHLARLPFRISCSLTAEAGRISRGPSARQRSTPALLSLLRFLPSVFSVRFSIRFCSPSISSRFSCGFLLELASRGQEVTSWPPCTSEQAISTAFLVDHCGTESRATLRQKRATFARKRTQSYEGSD